MMASIEGRTLGVQTPKDSALPGVHSLDEVVATKGSSSLKRSQSDLSHTYSTIFSLPLGSRPGLTLRRNSVALLNPTLNPMVSLPCPGLLRSMTTVDICTTPGTVFYRSISAGLQGYKVPITMRTYLDALAPVDPSTGCPSSYRTVDSVPTYSLQLHSVKSKYKYAPRTHLKIPASTGVSGPPSAQSPLYLTPSTPFSTPSCGSSAPSSCSSSVDREFNIAVGKRTTILPVEGLRDGYLAPMKLASGSKTTGLPPVSAIHTSQVIPVVE